MYEAFYGLREKPFALTPNPRYVFCSDRYHAVLEQLRYGLEQKQGFLLLSGVVGTGKTTLCRDLLEQLDPQRFRTALIFNPFLNPVEMLQTLLTEFGVRYPPESTRKELLDRLNRFLMAQLIDEKICVAIFDEAQHLSTEFLEQIRVLSNLETSTEKLLQIVLVGQPELRRRIQQPSLAQLDQRVSIRCTLTKLTREETERYVYHRLNVAGAHGRVTFTPGALRRIHDAAGGIPRLINQIADRTLLAGFVTRSQRIARKHVEHGLRSLHGHDDERSSRGTRGRAGGRLAYALGAVVLALAISAAALWYVGMVP